MFPVPGRHAGRVYVVTGAATGIGRACARRLAQEGAQVMIADIDPAVFKPIHEQTLEEFDRITGVGLRGYWLGAKAAVEHMRARGGRGVILNTASVQSFVGEKGFSAYQATKGAVLALTRSLAVDHAPDIRAVAIAPGLIATDAVKGIPADVMAGVVAAIPAARAAQPEEVAALAAYLASDEADYISGTAVILDGAYLAIG
jgi:meso-butanediol dehydrogenase/(S,S)-butanediol dehydrogenase/diacetyl reductase